MESLEQDQFIMSEAQLAEVKRLEERRNFLQERRDAFSALLNNKEDPDFTIEMNVDNEQKTVKPSDFTEKDMLDEIQRLDDEIKDTITKSSRSELEKIQ
jgi:hypothetical protein